MKKDPENAPNTDNAPKWAVHFKGMKEEHIRLGFLNNLEYNLAKDSFSVTPYDTFLSLSYTVRERLINRSRTV